MERPRCDSRGLETFVMPYMERVRVGLMELEASTKIFELKVYEGSERGWVPYFIKTLQEHYDGVFGYSVALGNPPPETLDEMKNKEDLIRRFQ